MRQPATVDGQGRAVDETGFVGRQVDDEARRVLRTTFAKRQPLDRRLSGGRVAAQELRCVATRLAERNGTSGDPRLDSLMAEIELRAAVELAKLESRRGK